MGPVSRESVDAHVTTQEDCTRVRGTLRHMKRHKVVLWALYMAVFEGK